MKIKKKILAWLVVLVLGISMALPAGSLTVMADQTESQSSEENSTAAYDEASVTEGEDSSDNTLETAKFRIQINYGFNGQFRLGAAIPVSVTVQTVKEDFDGTLRVIIPGNTDYATAPVSYEQEISVKKGEQTTTTMSVYDLSYITGFQLQLEDSEGVLALDKKINVNSNSSTSALTGVLCDDYDALSYLDNCDVNAGDYLGGSMLVKLDQSIFPEQKSGLEALSYLIIDNYSSSQLTTEQVETIKNWVASGGVLILGAGENGARTLSAFEGDLIKSTQGQSKEGELQLKGNEQYVESSDHTADTAGTDGEAADNTADTGANDISSDVSGQETGTADGVDISDGTEVNDGTVVSDGTVTDGTVVSDGTVTDGTAVSDGTVTDDGTTVSDGTATDGTAVNDGTLIGDAADDTTESQEDIAATGGDAVSDVQETASYIEIDKTPYKYTKADGVYQLTLDDAEPMDNIFREKTLVWNQDYGKGHVVVTAFDLSSELLNNWESKDTFATVLFSEAASGYSAERIQNLNYYNYSDHHEEATALYHMIHIGTPDMEKIMIILGIFVLLIGLVFYIFLKLIDKRSLLWILVPVAAVVCSGAILYVTSEIRINHPVTASMTEYYYDTDEGDAETTVDLLAVVPGTKSNKLQMNENLYGLQIYNLSDSSSLMPIVSYESADSENYDANVALKEAEKGYEVTIDNDRTFESTFIRMKTDKESSDERLILNAERSLEGISGSIENATEYDMKCVSVYVKGIEVAIGDLKAGERTSFVLADDKEMDAEFGQLGMPGIEMGTTEYDQIERIWDIFYERYLSDMDAMDVYTFGYIENVGENYIDNGKIDEQNTGIMICHESMGYKEYEGAQLYDLYTYITEHDNGFTDDGSQILYSTENECTFVLPVTDIRYMVRDDIIQNGTSSDNTTVYAYNGQTGEYDELFTEDNRIKFKSDCPYIAEDGSILLKFVCTDPGYECAPDLTVVGGES